MFRLFLMITGLVCALFMPTYSHAEQGGMLVAPQRIVLQNNERTDAFILANRSDVEKRFRITVINRAMQENGTIVAAEEPAKGEHFADKYLRIAPRSVTIGANQSQTVRVMSRLPARASDGEYRSHVLFEEVSIPPLNESPKPIGQRMQQIKIEPKVNFAMPVILRKGNLSAHISLQNPRLLENEFGAFILVDLKREGNRSTLGNINIYDGDDVVGTLNSVGVYMSVPMRIAKVPIRNAEVKPGMHLRIVYTPIDGSALPTKDTTLDIQNKPQVLE